MLSIHLRNNQTGEERQNLEKNLDWRGDFIWKDGNFACDCNREMFWLQAIGVDTDAMDDEEFQCSHCRYTIWIIDEDGKILYDERRT